MSELAIPVSDELIRAVISVRAAVVSEQALADEEWSSLTKHVGEIAVCRHADLLKAVSNDSVVDAVARDGDEDVFEFSDSNTDDLEILTRRGVQIKCRRKRAKAPWGWTGNVKLSSPFIDLYAVWLDSDYRVLEAYRLTRDQVVTIVQGRKSGPNKHKIPHSSARSVGTVVNLPDLAELAK